MQLVGFTMVSILFFISAAKYKTLTKSSNIGVFQFIYFFSSFWGQFGESPPPPPPPRPLRARARMRRGKLLPCTTISCMPSTVTPRKREESGALRVQGLG